MRELRRKLFLLGSAALVTGLAGGVALLGYPASQAAAPGRGARAQAPSTELHIQHIENGLLARMSTFQVPGVSIAVINDGKIEWAKGYGVTEAGGGRAVTPTTLFQAGSISKPVAAMGALYLVEHKMLALDEDVNQRLRTWKVPENDFTKTQKVTLRRLLSHSAGMSVHGFPGYPIDHALPSLVQVLDGARPANTPPIRVESVPGRDWIYSGGGYTVMQQLMIDVTRRPFPDFMRETVLAKLGMTHSAFAQPLPKAREAEAATGYYPGGEKVRGRWHVYPELAAAGLWTTPSDLARFAIEIQSSFAGRSNKVLSRAMARQMLTPQIQDDGLGVMLSESGPALRFKHGGRNEGFDCVLVAYAEIGQGAIIMVNANVDDEFMNGILRSLAREYHWRNFPGAPSDVAVQSFQKGDGMSQILLDIPEDSLLALRISAAEMGEELRMAAAAKLFEVGRLSSGAAAELAGIPKPLFLVRLGDYGVATFRQTEDELRRDLANA